MSAHTTHAALYITTCPSCADEYRDPLRAPETDEEPYLLWFEREYPAVARSFSRDAVLACLGLGVILAIAAYVGVHRP